MNIYPLTADKDVHDALSGSRDPHGAEKSDGGCVDTVESALDAPVETMDLAGLQRDLHNLASDHPEVRERLSQWRACMTQLGHDFSDVWKPTIQYGGLDAAEEQIDVATDDVECTRSSGWADYYYAALASYQEQAIGQDTNLFERLLGLERARLAAVRRELDRRG